MEAILKKEIVSNKALCRTIGVSSFIILTALGAFVRIPLPFTPVPITLQTFFVLLSGLFLGSNLGAVTQLSYMFLGLSGLPIFTGTGSGLLYLGGPTAGYIFGFVLASFCVGIFVRYAGDNILFTFACVFLADLIILLSGVVWLKFLFGYPFIKLLFIGFIPFLLGDLVKAAFAAGIYLKLKPRLKNIF
jgi:biotin transport system substrate-specific component